MQKFNNILLFGGETNNENMPVGFYSSLAMLPLRGKPIIWWQLENLKEKGINNYIIVASSNNKKLINYIKEVLIENYKIKLVLINSNKSILSSLKYGLKKADVTLPTRVILGDTMITNSINQEKDILFTSKNVTDSQNWCLIDKNMKLYDKKKNINLTDKQALIGYYTFSDTQYLLNCCIKARLMLKKELSDALLMYMGKYRLNLKLIDDWYDLGHTSGLIKAKNILFNARCFNSISIDSELGILTKKSTNTQKLEDEALWYKNIPCELKILSPRLIDFKKDEKYAYLIQELYGYPSLQELYLSGNVNIEDWRLIIEKLFNLHKNFEKYSDKKVDKSSLKWLYYDKTFERLDSLINQNNYWNLRLDKDIEDINGVKYLGINRIKDEIKEKSKKICQNPKISIIHGDYCFSNILFDSSNYVFKLIDPRGRLDKEPTIYGDAKYDIAKLRHSVVGLYDFIVHGLFKLKDIKDKFEYKISVTRDYTNLEKIFDNFVVENGFDVNEIKFIEGLLFLSMIPLHKDNFLRQKMLYIRAIELLNKTI